MTRVTDRPIPAVIIPDPDRPAWMSGQLVVALERLPQSAYVWDDDDPAVVWDADGDPYVWDAPDIAAGLTDVWCDLIGLTISHGQPDPNDQYRTSSALLELRDPGDGRYRTRTVDGRLIYYATGRRLSVYWADPDGQRWWLFNGRISAWRERLDGTIGIDAYSLDSLGRSDGAAWTAGTDGQHLPERVASILAARAPDIVCRCDAGDVTLSVPAAQDRPPLDAIREAAWSDGGIVYSDADDTLVVRDRRWRSGRTDQADGVPILTDNVCAHGPDAVVVWSPETADDGLRQAGRVRLENMAQPSLVAVADAPPNRFVPTTVVFTHSGRDLWRTQAEGNALAAFTVDERSTARVALGTADVYLHDRRFDYWSLILLRRLGDRIRFQHDDPFGFWDVMTVLTTLVHTITPDSWVVNVGTSPAVGYTALQLWDSTLLVWDDSDPDAVWR